MPVASVTQSIPCFNTNELFSAYQAEGMLRAGHGISPRGDHFHLWLSPTIDGDFVITVTPVDASVSCPIAGGRWE